jgi:hypothetical protein
MILPKYLSEVYKGHWLVVTGLDNVSTNASIMRTNSRCGFGAPGDMRFIVLA